MRKLTLWLLIGLAALLGACATLTPPRNVDDSIAYGYGQLAAARGTAAKLLDRGAITAADARAVQEKADQARTALDAARRLRGAGDTGGAQSQLTLGLDILLELETYLKAREAR
jgi:hypothetical protein